MFNECRHILTSGHRCKAAALRGQVFCYYHTAARRYSNVISSSADPLLLPSTEDTAGVQIALNQVLRAFASHRIDRRHAGVYFYGLQIAARLAGKSNENLGESVRETCEEDDVLSQLPGFESAGTYRWAGLAPEKTTCEPPADCINCRRREFCENFEYHEDDVLELEARLQAEQDAADSEKDEEENEE